MSKKVSDHITGKAQVLFMAAARALTNKRTNKEEFSIKIKIEEKDESVKHLSEVADYKVDTKTNRLKENKGFKIISFSSDFAPAVFDKSNTRLEADEIPFFDGRYDKGEAVVLYKVIDYGSNKIVRLSGIKILDIVKGERPDSDGEGSGSSVAMDDIMAKLKEIG